MWWGGMSAVGFVALGWSALSVGLGAALSFVVLARAIRHGRTPRPGEWLVLLLGTWAVRTAAPPPREAIAALAPGLLANSQGRYPPAFTIASSAVILVVLIALGAARDRASAWFRTLALAALATLAVWGPLTALAEDLVWRLHPWDPHRGSAGSWVAIVCAEQVAQLPLMLLHAVPYLAAIRDGRGPDGRGRVWTEWAGLALTTPLVLGMFGLDLLAIAEDGPNVDRIARPLGLATAGLLAVAVLRWLGPAWGRVLDPPRPPPAS